MITLYGSSTSDLIVSIQESTCRGDMSIGNSDGGTDFVTVIQLTRLPSLDFNPGVIICAIRLATDQRNVGGEAVLCPNRSRARRTRLVNGTAWRSSLSYSDTVAFDDGAVGDVDWTNTW